MNIDVIEPLDRIRISSNEIKNNKISAIYKHSVDQANEQQQLFVGLTNGDLLIYNAVKDTFLEESGQVSLADTRTILVSSAISISTHSSYQDIKRLFRGHENRSYKLANMFSNITKDGSSINKIESLPISPTKLIILITTLNSLEIFEIVGNHINQIYHVPDSKNSLSFYVLYNDRRLFFVGTKKKLTIFQIINKSRNIFQFNKLKEVVMKDKIRSIDKFDEDSIIIGLVNNYVICEFADFGVSSLAIEKNDNMLSQGTSFSYFGLSSSTPVMWTIQISDDLFLLVKDTQIVKIDRRNGPSMILSSIKLSRIPIEVLFIYPIYLFVVYPKKIEIVDVTSGDLIQKLGHSINSGHSSIILTNSVISIASGADILQFNILPFQAQIDQFLSISGKGTLGNIKDPRNDLKYMGIEKAITLVSNIDDANSLFNDAKNKLMKLMYLYSLKATLLFESYSKYHEALVDISSEWLVSFADVLNLFPAFINGQLRSKGVTSDGNENKKNSSLNVIKRITVEELELNNYSESEYDTDNTTKKGMALKQPHGQSVKAQNIRKFIKAVNNLIIYLTDQRRILSTFMDKDVLTWKNIEINPSDIYPEFDGNLETVATVIDTSLFLCYFYCKPMLLGPLLRLPNNYCDSKIVNECLLSNIHNHVQQRNSKQPNFIKELLDFYYARSLHEEALEMLYKLAHDEGTIEHSNEDDNKFDDFIKGPDLTIQYLRKLTDDNLYLVLKYSSWVIDQDKNAARPIFMNDSYECESYDNTKVLQFLCKKDQDLGIMYLEWLLFASDISESLKKSKLYLQLETKLCLLYLKQLKSGKHQNDYYNKLLEILKTSQTFEPWLILKEMPTTQDKFLRLTIYIYKKLGEHEKSIDVLFNQLNDLDAAMEYCLEIYNRQQSSSLGSSLFYKLLEDLLMNYHENCELIVRLLSEHGAKIPILKTLSVLPRSFPMHKLKTFFTIEIKNTDEQVKDSHLVSQLYKVGSTNLQYKVMTLQNEGYKIGSSKQPCAICNKRLGYSVFTITKDHEVVHYGCAQSRKK